MRWHNEAWCVSHWCFRSVSRRVVLIFGAAYMLCICASILSVLITLLVFQPPYTPILVLKIPFIVTRSLSEENALGWLIPLVRMVDHFIRFVHRVDICKDAKRGTWMCVICAMAKFDWMQNLSNCSSKFLCTFFPPPPLPQETKKNGFSWCTPRWKNVVHLRSMSRLLKFEDTSPLATNIWWYEWSYLSPVTIQTYIFLWIRRVTIRCAQTTPFFAVFFKNEGEKFSTQFKR